MKASIFNSRYEDRDPQPDRSVLLNTRETGEGSSALIGSVPANEPAPPHGRTLAPAGLFRSAGSIRRVVSSHRLRRTNAIRTGIRPDRPGQSRGRLVVAHYRGQGREFAT